MSMKKYSQIKNWWNSSRGKKGCRFYLTRRSMRLTTGMKTGVKLGLSEVRDSVWAPWSTEEENSPSPAPLWEQIAHSCCPRLASVTLGHLKWEPVARGCWPIHSLLEEESCRWTPSHFSLDQLSGCLCCGLSCEFSCFLFE